ncbi:TonB-dependent receptor [Pontibacter arcticus]|uniref:TonB-dependent receptor n=1 Tax=Pontibacter arcticus TaxID=2080288 RepID=A0A364RI66_9BACT|nr:TonB-dependent receptor [Pontibacter arcticus]RAU83964.1 TonB-dependent receptor [Pontibacter arcticus]
MRLILTVLLLVAITTAGFAQQGILKGRVTDKATGESIIGAVVFVKGTNKGTATDYEGSFTLTLEQGTYPLSVTFISYKPSETPNITIKPGQTTVVDVQLEENNTQLEAVEIVATRQTNTEMALMQDLRQSEIVVSGVSGEQIAKSLDRDAAAVVKRIPGVTVMNDRYIMIRGLSQRYNTVLLNDALAPSTETDSRAFSFDVLPTSVLDRILVYKSGAPELPGEFGGGVIKVYTKNFADENTFALSITGGVRAGTTFNDFIQPKGSKTDLLGFDNGYRALPGSLPANLENLSGDAKLNEIRKLPNTWGSDTKTALPDLRLSAGLTRRFNLGSIQGSNISALSYSNTSQFNEVTRYNYVNFDQEEYKYNDKEYSSNVRVSALSNFAFRLNNNNKLEFRNMFNQMGQNQYIGRTGYEANSANVDVNNAAMRYESRTIYSGQLQGTHDRNNEKTTFTWTAGYNYSKRNEPDYKRIRSQRNLNTDDPFIWQFAPRASTFDAGRFYSDLNENTVIANAQIEHKFTGKDTLAENQPKIRAGFYAERKDRVFDARWMSYNRGADFNDALLETPIEQLFAPENINGTTGFTLSEGTNPTDHYDAANTLVAGFVGGTLPLHKLNLSGGVRVEYNRQQLQTERASGEAIDVDNPVVSILPSLNAIYTLSQKSVLRGGYSISVNRPEFRELAPFAYYDFQQNADILGDENTTTATIHNADLRYEFYPNPTEMISFGAFYKHFINPIELYNRPSSGNPIYAPGNAETAQSYGIETEIRKSFLNLSDRSFIQNLSLVLNAALIKSKVDLGDGVKAEGQSRNRAMYGQSPYIVNAGLYFQDDKKALQVNLLYNVIGKRIFAAGNVQEPTIYEMPRNVIDLAVTKGIGKHLELKAGIQDILNQKVLLKQDLNEDAKINSTDKDYTVFRRGSYSTLGINYKF